METTNPVIELVEITKTFPGVVALSKVDVSIRRNEIFGLVGENGAGKSTLMKILIGLYQPNGGRFLLDGTEVVLKDPDEAIRNGIGMVFQEGNLIPNLTVLENIFLCHEETFSKAGFISKRKMYEEAVKVMAVVDLDLDPDTLVGDLRAADKQMVEISRLIWLSRLYGRDNPVLILDEPTTVLLEEEVDTLFRILRELKKNASIVFISHRLEEVIQNTDRMLILKDGEVVTEMISPEADISVVERHMVGHGFTDDRYLESQQSVPAEEIILEVQGLRMERKFKPLDFRLKAGEIISLVGLIGSGKEEVCRCLAGIDRADEGTITVSGTKRQFFSPKDAIQAGIGYLPVDRRSDGLALSMNVEENINLLILKEARRGWLLDGKKESASAEYWIRENNIKTPSSKAKTANLSGGNQQKVVLAKWLSSHVKILIVDHPTRGIDVGAKEEIYKRLRQLAEDGMGIIIMCDTLEEDIGLSNRMLILKDGVLRKEIDCPKENKPEPIDVIGSIV